jgi:hypothetical protein
MRYMYEAQPAANALVCATLNVDVARVMVLAFVRLTSRLEIRCRTRKYGFRLRWDSYCR